MATRKGDLAKKLITDTILASFPGSFIVDKKIYVWSKENGEQVQVAISLTCPKTPIECGNIDSGGSMSSPQVEHVTELSSEDKQAVERLKSMLGI